MNRRFALRAEAAAPGQIDRRRAGALLAAALLAGAGRGARAQPGLPERNLLVELRQASSAATAWDLSSAEASRERLMSSVRVRNGARATLTLAHTRPVQTWAWVPGLNWPVATTQWISSGDEIEVEPRWPGGAQPVAVTIRLRRSRFDPAVAPGSGELPRRDEAALATTVDVPPGEWITLAEGSAAVSGRGIGTRDAAQRSLQLRISLTR